MRWLQSASSPGATRGLYYLTVCLLTAVLAACRSQPQLVIIEPAYKNTIKLTRALKPGDTVHITFQQLQPGETFRMHKCGIDCTTASTYRLWHLKDIDTQKEFALPISEPGRYYFWLQSKGPAADSTQHIVQPQDGSERGGALHITFVSGSRLSIAVNNVP